MTTQVRYLDRDRLARVEPREGDDRQRSWLSPYAIPTAVEFQVTPGKGWEITFRYYDDFEAAAPPSTIAAGVLPPISITVAVHTRKVLKLNCMSPFSPEELPAIADVLTRASHVLNRVAERMSYQLTAAVLRMIAEDIKVGDRRAPNEQ